MEIFEKIFYVLPPLRWLSITRKFNNIHDILNVMDVVTMDPNTIEDLVVHYGYFFDNRTMRGIVITESQRYLKNPYDKSLLTKIKYLLKKSTLPINETKAGLLSLNIEFEIKKIQIHQTKIDDLLAGFRNILKKFYKSIDDNNIQLDFLQKEDEALPQEEALDRNEALFVRLRNENKELTFRIKRINGICSLLEDKVKSLQDDKEILMQLLEKINEIMPKRSYFTEYSKDTSEVQDV